jgi:O-antigen/teichoic acid export membrane protein
MSPEQINNSMPITLGYFLRLLTLSARLILITLALRYGGVELVGNFGVVIAIVGFMPTISGLEIYQRYNRKTNQSAAPNYSLFYQINLLFSVLLATILTAILVFIVLWDMSMYLKVLVFVSAVLEVIFLDVNRFEYASKNYRSATINNFKKSFVIVPIVFLSCEIFKNDFLISYLILNCIFVGFLSSRMYKLHAKKTNLSKYFNKKLISKYFLKNIAYAKSFIISSFSINMMDYFDRVLLKFVLSPQQLGYYIIAISLVNAIRSLIYFGPVVKFYPDIVSSLKKYNISHAKKLSVRILALSIMLIAPAFLFLYVIMQFNFIDILDAIKGAAESNMIVIAMICLVISQLIAYIAHYLLYGANLDKKNAMLNAFGCSLLFLGIFLINIDAAVVFMFVKATAILLATVLKLKTYVRWSQEIELQR